MWHGKTLSVWKDPVGLERPVDPQAQDGAIGIQVSAQSTVGT
jgi:hypothetical protein